jgi:hypothetical protein
VIKRILTLSVALAALVVSSTSFAAPPAAAAFCDDVDGDGWYVVSAGCVPMANAQGSDDCDDGNPAIHPKATEVWDNNIDEDCDGSDATTPNLAHLRAFKVDPANKAAVKKWMKDRDTCAAATGKCAVNFTAGTYMLAEGYDFYSVECGKAKKVIATSDVEYKLAKKLEAAGCGCVKKQAVRRKVSKPSTPAAAPLPGETTPTTAPTVKGKRSVQVDYSAPIAAAQATGEKAQKTAEEAQKAADKAQAKADSFDEAFKGHTVQLGALDQALKAETERATTRENEIEEKADAAGANAQRAFAAVADVTKDVTKLQSRGPFLEGFVGGGTIAQRDFVVTKNKKSVVVRGNWAPSLEIGGNVGLETESGRFNAFGSLVPSWDEGESNIGGVAGVEYAWRLAGSNTFIGVHGIYQRHASGGNVVLSKAVSNGYGGGLTFVYTSDAAHHVGLQARLSALYEEFGTDANKVSVQTGPAIRLMVDVLAGIRLLGK